MDRTDYTYMNNNNHNNQDLTHLPDHELELIAGDPDDEHSEAALDILETRASCRSNSNSHDLGYRGNPDFFSIRTV